MIIRRECGGARSEQTVEDLCAELAQARGQRALAFASERMRLVVEFAQVVAKDQALRESIPLQVFSFWTRKGAIETMRKNFEERLPSSTLAVGRGVAFHLPPGNVDTIFLYSWVIAFLCGNVSVTRLPSVLGPTMERVLEVFSA